MSSTNDCLNNCECPHCFGGDFEEDFFSTINTEAKAYCLGWAAGCSTGDGSGIKISADSKNIELVKTLRNCMSFNSRIVYDFDTVTFAVNPTKVVSDILNHLQFSSDEEKNSSVDMPDTLNRFFMWAFIRGLFDSKGSIVINPRSCVVKTNPSLARKIADFCDVSYQIVDDGVMYYGVNCLDFLSRLYDNAPAGLVNPMKYNMYVDMIVRPTNNIPSCKFVRTSPDAVAPSKNRASDEGYDLWLIGVDKKISDDTIRYETNIKVQPGDGWHVEILPRSSLSNSGYMLANSVGLIDESYRGTLKVVLTKVDKAAKPIEFPFKAVQMVMRKSVHFVCTEESSLDNTARNDGGFGSTDEQKTA